MQASRPVDTVVCLSYLVERLFVLGEREIYLHAALRDHFAGIVEELILEPLEIDSELRPGGADRDIKPHHQRRVQYYLYNAALRLAESVHQQRQEYQVDERQYRLHDYVYHRNDEVPLAELPCHRQVEFQRIQNCIFLIILVGITHGQRPLPLRERIPLRPQCSTAPARGTSPHMRRPFSAARRGCRTPPFRRP